MNASSLNRRRFIGICAATAGWLWSPVRSHAAAQFEWRGTALGADARIVIAGLERDAAQSAVDAARAEIERLESSFSLYRPDSELTTLNRNGMLDNPTHDFRLLLERSLDTWEKTAGAFNPAIQPVWSYLARHFARADRQQPPNRGTLAALAAQCNPRRMDIAARRIRLAPGMALTFNGIAQGFITDSVAALLAAHGLRDTLIDLGEILALPGRSWNVNIPGTDTRLLLNRRAVAQSAGNGTVFTADGRWHHLIDPATGISVNNVSQVTVAAPQAAMADALSTALFVAPPNGHSAIMRQFPDAELIAAG